MKLTKLTARRYRSLREETVELRDLNLFIGTNASGKSTILDVLRFLHEGLQQRDFRQPVGSRGGILHLAWKGEAADQIEIETEFKEGDQRFEWSLKLSKENYDFSVQESLSEIKPGSPPIVLLEVDQGRGWWWSGSKGAKVNLAQSPSSCALSAAAVDESFPARSVEKFVSRWGFFDPSPFLLRRGWTGLDASRFDPYGRNLAERLYVLQESSPDSFNQIVIATQSVLGLPTKLELRKSRPFEDEAEGLEDRTYFVQTEPGLRFGVHQIGASSGTLRILALMTALFGETEKNLIGIEEPENHIHPTALAGFAEYLLKARERVQLLVTTHSPLLLNYLNDPEAVCTVQHVDDDGTKVTREHNASGVREALQASGFGLGEFHESKGFGG